MTETNTDRHPKWVRVEPGTVIPAGQPYAVQYAGPAGHGGQFVTYPNPDGKTAYRTAEHGEFYVDSSWVPPLVLPTEPTWGIVVQRVIGGEVHCRVDKWWATETGQGKYAHSEGSRHPLVMETVAAFIPLTDEQVARIEAAR